MSKVKSQQSMVNGQSQDGYIALTSVLVISAIVLVLVVGAFNLSLVEMEKGSVRYNAEKAISWANLCAEEALQEIREDSDYTTEGKNYGDVPNNDGCSFTVSGDWPKTIQSTGFFQEHTRRLEITVSDDDPLLVIESWEETTGF